MATTDPADDTTGIVEAVHREAARLRAEDEERRVCSVLKILNDYTVSADTYRDIVARAILDALDDVAP